MYMMACCHLAKSSKTIIACWNVAKAFLNPNVIREYSKNLVYVTNAGMSTSMSSIPIYRYPEFASNVENIYALPSK